MESAIAFFGKVFCKYAKHIKYCNIGGVFTYGFHFMLTNNQNLLTEASKLQHDIRGFHFSNTFNGYAVNNVGGNIRKPSTLLYTDEVGHGGLLLQVEFTMRWLAF